MSIKHRTRFAVSTSSLSLGDEANPQKKEKVMTRLSNVFAEELEQHARIRE